MEQKTVGKFSKMPKKMKKATTLGPCCLKCLVQKRSAFLATHHPRQRHRLVTQILMGMSMQE